mmetsp:Transcript_37699/g.82813  ORF Transcript_37699/g.82813 Transcript_37699/m.82813 type:complete len:244 (+) Transcript_37699:112-843(+)
MTCSTPSLNVHVDSSGRVGPNKAASTRTSPLASTRRRCRAKETFTSFLSPLISPSLLKVISTSSSTCRHLYCSVSPLGTESSIMPGLMCAGFLAPILLARLAMSPLFLLALCFFVAATQAASVLQSFKVRFVRLHSSSLSSKILPTKQSPLKVWPTKPHACTRPEAREFSSRFFATPLSSQYTLTPSKPVSFVGSITGKISTLVEASRRSKVLGSISPLAVCSCRFMPVLCESCPRSTLRSAV